MKKKTEMPKPMSEYEVDAMWMSYRYAIGRHTIAACMHAGNMIKEIYHRLEEKRIPFTVYDIRREINQHLEWNFNFGLSLYVQQDDYDPIKALVEFAKRVDVKKAGGIFKYLSNNRVEVSVNSNHEYEYNISEPINRGELYSHELHDLLVWYNMSCALDKENHKIAVTEYEGKVEEHEVFEYVKIQQYIDAEEDFAIEYVDINNYLDNSFVHKWIAKDYIKEIKEK
jgi:hypothetical protein